MRFPTKITTRHWTISTQKRHSSFAATARLHGRLHLERLHRLRCADQLQLHADGKTAFRVPTSKTLCQPNRQCRQKPQDIARKIRLLRGLLENQLAGMAWNRRAQYTPEKPIFR